MGSIINRIQGALSSCFSHNKDASAGEEDEMSGIARPRVPQTITTGATVTSKTTNTASMAADASTTVASENRKDDLLVQKGLPRTRILREKLVDENNQALVGERMTQAPLFKKLSDTDYIHALNVAFKPEFEFLKDADQITVEQGSKPVIGNYGPNADKSPSQLLYGKYYAEVDRTIVGLLAMKWILADNYEQFTMYQNQFIRLSQPAFRKMRDVFIEAFGDSLGSYMLIVSMIVNDLGKNSELRNKIKSEDPTRWSIMNHDEVIYHAAYYKKLDLVEEFGGVNRKRLMKGIELGGRLNLGQLAQGECVPGNLRDVAQIMSDDPKAFPMKFCEIVLDVAGAAGHIDSRGANAWIAPVDQAYSISRECVLAVISGEKSLREAYDGILDGRATLLVDKGFKQLHVTDPDERSTLRLMTMSRAASKPAAEAVENAVNALPTRSSGKPIKDFFGRPIENVRDALLKGLMVDGVDDGLAIIPYYGPGVLAEAARVTKGLEPDKQAKAMVAIFRFFARVFIGTKPVYGKAGHVVDCDISFIQEHIRSPKFLENPFILDEVDYPTKQPYGEDIEPLMREIHGIRRLERRKTGTLQQSG